MTNVNNIYEMKQTILGIVNANPIGFSDLIDSLYIRASKESGLVRSEYNQNFQFTFAYDHKLKNNKLMLDMNNIIATFIEGVIRDPNNANILKSIGKDSFIYNLNEYELQGIIYAAISTMDISTGESTAFKISL